MILLDSDVMIDLLRQYPPAMRWFNALDDEEELLLYHLSNQTPFGRGAVTAPLRRNKMALQEAIGITGIRRDGTDSRLQKQGGAREIAA